MSLLAQALRRPSTYVIESLNLMGISCKFCQFNARTLTQTHMHTYTNTGSKSLCEFNLLKLPVFLRLNWSAELIAKFYHGTGKVSNCWRFNILR